MSGNFYIDRAKSWLEDKQIDRITANLCSITLGREFGESVESYLNRNPEKKAYFEWWEEVRNNIVKH